MLLNCPKSLQLVTVFCLLESSVSLAEQSSCIEVYEGIETSSQIQVFRRRFDDAIANIKASCMSGAATCSTHLSTSVIKAVNVAGFTAAVNARMISKLATSPISAMRFFIEQDKLREMIIEPLVEAINKGNADVTEARGLIYQQFGFDQLLEAINRDVETEVKSIAEKK